MERFTSKDEFGANQLVLDPATHPGEHTEFWCVAPSEGGVVIIRGAAVDRLAEYENLKERARLLKINPILERFTTYQLKAELRRRRKKGGWFRYVLWRMGL